MTDHHDQTNWNLLTDNDVISLGDTVVDVGSCKGTYISMFSSILGATGKIYAVEVFPPNYQHIEMRFGHMENIEFYNLAVSDKDGIEPIYMNQSDEMCGILKKNGNKIGQVQSITLDTLLKDEKEISLIKIDVEGAELRVLYGMKETMKKTKCILLECHYDEDWPEIRKILVEENGFNCYNVEKRQTVTESSPRPYQCFCRREK